MASSATIHVFAAWRFLYRDIRPKIIGLQLEKYGGFYQLACVGFRFIIEQILA